MSLEYKDPEELPYNHLADVTRSEGAPMLPMEDPIDPNLIYIMPEDHPILRNKLDTAFWHQLYGFYNPPT